MNIYRKPHFADSTGDAIPFYHEGRYHLFTLTPPKGTTVYPARLRTTWEHAVSDDLVHWEQLETALYPSDDETAPDASGIWTGAVIYGEGKYHAFYTGYSLKCRFQQTICHATSADGVKWQKDEKNPVITPLTELYEAEDWRDPYVFYNEDEGLYWILISARKKSVKAENRKGTVILYRSPDLVNWEYKGEIYAPGDTNCPECSEMYRIGNKWYLSYSRFSEFVNTIYRISDSPYGPWETPVHDGIGGRRFYAAKSMQDERGRRFYFGWAHDRAEQSDSGEWYWGGAFCVPHEVRRNSEGELSVMLPHEIEESITEPLEYRIIPGEGSAVIGRDSVRCKSDGTSSYGFFELSEKSVMFSANVKINKLGDYFGLLLKSDKYASVAAELRFERQFSRVALYSLPMAVDPFWQQSCQAIPPASEPGPDGVRVCEKPLSFKAGDTVGVKIIADGDMLEIFIDEKIAFTYRIYRKADYLLGYIVQDADVEYTEIKITK